MNKDGQAPIRFIFLTFVEVEGAVIRWDENVTKSQELVEAALVAGFSAFEIHESPLGTLEEEFAISPTEICRRGSRALIGMNGSTLLEITETQV